MIKTDLMLKNVVEYPGWNKDGTSGFFMVRDLFWEDDKIALTDGVIQLPCCRLEYIKPVPISKEWLMKFGFTVSPAANSTYISIPKLKGEIHFEDFRGGLVCILYCSTGSFIPENIEYVHQLQNLFHSLTHEELTVPQLR